MGDYKLYGVTMSPFSMKMRAYFRYRRIRHQWVTGKQANDIALTKVDPYMLPVVEDAEGVFKHDSTFLIDEIEQKIPDRRTDPDNPADAFLACLIEDYCDEWLLLPFFMMRWRTQTDRLANGRWILYEYTYGKTTDPAFEEFAKAWADRQVSIVSRICGSEDMFGILDESLAALLRVTERAFCLGMFLFGSRPSRAEFALYGILSQLVIDHSSSSFLRETANSTYRWVTVMEDLSGNEGAWEPVSTDRERLESSGVLDLLRLSAKYHLPMLKANTEAIDAGETMFSFNIDGQPFTRHAVDRYLHCIPELKKRYEALPDDARATLDPILRETGCLAYLT